MLLFENLNRAPGYGFCVVGISDALTAELRTINGLQVVSRQSVLAPAQARSTLEMYPACLHAHDVLGWTALAEHRNADATSAFETASSLSRGPSENVPGFLFAMVHDALADRDAALHWLERCLAARDSRLFWFRAPPTGGSLLDDPRFAEQVRRVDVAVLNPR